MALRAYNRCLSLFSHHQYNSYISYSILLKLHELQDFYIENELIQVLMTLMHCRKKSIIREIVALMSFICYNANAKAQDAALTFFQGTKDEVFFSVIRELFTEESELIRERLSIFYLST